MNIYLLNVNLNLVDTHWLNFVKKNQSSFSSNFSALCFACLIKSLVIFSHLKGSFEIFIVFDFVSIFTKIIVKKPAFKHVAKLGKTLKSVS